MAHEVLSDDPIVSLATEVSQFVKFATRRDRMATIKRMHAQLAINCLVEGRRRAETILRRLLHHVNVRRGRESSSRSALGRGKN